MANHTLTKGATTITLPAGMLWEDEYTTAPIKTAATPTIDGGMIFEQAVQVAGRQVTLAGANDRGWITKGVLDDLYAFTTSTGEMTLTLADGRVLTVVFAGNPISAEGLWPLCLPDDTDYFIATIRLLAVA